MDAEIVKKITEAIREVAAMALEVSNNSARGVAYHEDKAIDLCDSIDSSLATPPAYQLAEAKALMARAMHELRHAGALMDHAKVSNIGGKMARERIIEDIEAFLSR